MDKCEERLIARIRSMDLGRARFVSRILVVAGGILGLGLANAAIIGLLPRDFLFAGIVVGVVGVCLGVARLHILRLYQLILDLGESRESS